MPYRRHSLRSILSSALLAFALLLAFAAVPGMQGAQPQDRMPVGNPFPPMLSGDPDPGPRLPNPKRAQANSREMLQQNQREIKEDIEQLCAMAQQLKEQSDKTNSADVLSVSLVKKAKKIEKLAKKIGNLARRH